VDRSKSTASGPGSTGLGGARVRIPEDGSLCNYKDVATGELFLELSYEPLLDAVERAKEFVRHINDDSFAAGSAVNLACSGDVEITEGTAKL